MGISDKFEVGKVKGKFEDRSVPPADDWSDDLQMHTARNKQAATGRELHKKN